MVCYEGSRKNVFEALEYLDLLGKIKVIILELAYPKNGQDDVIIENNFQFFEGIYTACFFRTIYVNNSTSISILIRFFE